MALLEYNITYDEDTKKSYVTLNVLGVDKNDKIVFRSNYDGTYIRYNNGSPFEGSSGPQANQTFEVGARKKGPFTVVPSFKKELHFDCGEMAPVRQKHAAGQTAIRDEDLPKDFVPWGSGADTPP
jgi:hypothetical protein